MFGDSVVRRPICEQWGTDRQQTHINYRLIGPAGQQGMPTDRREENKTNTGGAGVFISSDSVDKHLKEKLKSTESRRIRGGSLCEFLLF